MQHKIFSLIAFSFEQCNSFKLCIGSNIFVLCKLNSAGWLEKMLEHVFILDEMHVALTNQIYIHLRVKYKSTSHMRFIPEVKVWQLDAQARKITGESEAGWVKVF